MLYLIIACLLGVVVWQARQLAGLRRNIGHLGQALRQRTPFLRSESSGHPADRTWAETVEAANQLMEEHLQVAEDRRDELSQLETTLGNIQEAVLIVDSDNYIILINNALRRMFPASTRTVGSRVETVLQSGEFLEYLREVRAGKGAPQREIEFVGAPGSAPVWVEITGSVIREAGPSRDTWTLFVLHDVSRQRRLENVRKEFVANVSHELKTPLSVIKGYAETLVDDHATMPVDIRASFLGTILRHTERLVAIVEDLLALSRLEAPEAAVKITPEDLAALMRSAVRDFAEAYKSADHQLDLVVADPTIPILADSLKLGQVLANLLENGLRHTPPGTRVELGAQVVAEAGHVEFWVADDGPGIPAADLPRIFERFYRVDKGRSREKGGTGLGLSIVKHIVQLHGGTIRAESRVGQGTRIVMRLPLEPKTRRTSEGLPEDGAASGV